LREKLIYLKIEVRRYIRNRYERIHNSKETTSGKKRREKKYMSKIFVQKYIISKLYITSKIKLNS